MLVHHQKYISLRDAGGSIDRFAAVVNGDGAAGCRDRAGHGARRGGAPARCVVLPGRGQEAPARRARRGPRRRHVPPGPRDLQGQVGAHGRARRGDGPARPARWRDARRGEGRGASRQGRPRHADGPRVPGAAGRDGRDLPRGRAARRATWRRPCATTTTRSRSSPRRSRRRRSPAGTRPRASSRRWRSPTSSTRCAGYFGLGESPTGSRDPYGLRRAGQGAVRAALDFWRPKPGEKAPDLEALVADASGGYGGLKQPADADREERRRPSCSTGSRTCSRRAASRPTRWRRSSRRPARSPTRSTSCAGSRRCSARGASGPKTSRRWPRPSSARRTSSRRRRPARPSTRSCSRPTPSAGSSRPSRALQQASGGLRGAPARPRRSSRADRALLRRRSRDGRGRARAREPPRAAPDRHSRSSTASRTFPSSEEHRDPVRLLLRRRQGRRQQGHEGHARRQGRRPRRDDERGRARAARLHDLDPGLQRLLRERGHAARRGRPADGRGARQARGAPGQEARRSRRPAAGLRAQRLEVLDARDDGHDPEPRHERPLGRGPEGEDRQPPLRQGQLPALHPDVRQRRARHRQGQVRARARRRQEEVQGEDGRRARREGARRGDRALQGGRAARDEGALPAGPARAARRRPRRRLQVVDEPARHHLPQAQRHPARPRHRGQRAGDGVRQHGRHLGDGRRLHAQPLDGSEGVLRRVPAERAGRGRGVGRPHAAPDHRPREGDAEGLPAAARDHDPARAPLQGRPGLRVHDPGQHALHAPDPERQAHGPRRDQHRGGHVRRGPDHEEGGAAQGRAAGARPAAAPDLRPQGQEGCRGRRQGAARFAGRRDRGDRVHRGRGGGLDAEGQARAAGPHGDGARRHPRHVGRAGQC